MRIQSVQNQQMQSRPIFSAVGHFAPKIPDIYPAKIRDAGHSIDFDETLVDSFLQYLLARQQDIIPVRLGKKIILQFRAKVRGFKLGKDIIVLPTEKNAVIPALYMLHPDGSRTRIFRNPTRGTLKMPDPDFDNLHQVLQEKPKRAPVSARKKRPQTPRKMPDGLGSRLN